MSLDKYNSKRDFSKTSEPKAGRSKSKTKLMFVIQKHDASRLHYDFRLEMEGVLKSWVLPKGLPREKGERRLAIEVEDHPLDYLDFEGEIPEGNYGAGQVLLQEKGFYVLLKKEPQKIKFALQGENLQGAYLLIKTGQAENHWLMIKYL